MASRRYLSGWGEIKFDLAVPLVPADPKKKNESIKQYISVLVPFL
jgi:hypothetical protein